MVNEMLERKLGVKVEYESLEGLTLMAVDYWCYRCMRQPATADRKKCDICGDLCSIVQSKEQARKIMSILFLEI